MKLEKISFGPFFGRSLENNCRLAWPESGAKEVPEPLIGHLGLSQKGLGQ